MENNVSNSLSLVTNVSSCPTTVNDETKSMEENANNVSFVNQGAIAWSEMRREWVGDRSKRPHRAPREPTIRHALANERSKSRNRFFRRLIEGVRDEDPRPRIDALSDGFPLAISCSPRWFLMAEGEKGECVLLKMVSAGTQRKREEPKTSFLWRFRGRKRDGKQELCLGRFEQWLNRTVVKLDLVECSKDEAMACDGRMWQNTDWKKPDHFLEVVLHVAVPSLHVPRGRASAGVAEIGSCSNFPVVLDGGRRRTSRRGQLVAVKTTRPWCDVSVWLLKKRGRGIPDSTEETSNHWEPCWLHALSLSE
ncbi:hypothetical protein MUK42_02083 [Musa troglodytarum]|uniref:Gag1-like clamp domain-containing protein n=1 Tax=Musa troglodytarum TaxID=320322 RepID=A0A9E7FQN9_9LILI|nr:hypothetical protein MUK42_02083 [Musa troglodytarum]